MEAVKVVMNAEASSLMLLDEMTGDLNVSIPTGPVKDEIIGMTVPKGKGIGGWVISYKQPFISNDVVESDIFWKDLSADFTTKNIICVPLFDGSGEAFGVLQAINKKNDELFKNEEVSVFEALASHISIAIERSKIYEEQESRLQERESYISGLHHRVRNTISMISGLIEFDLDGIQDEHAQRAMVFTNARLRTLARAHTMLFENNISIEMDVREYLTKIVQGVEILFEGREKDITLSTRFEQIKLNPNKGVLCGLIVNELLMNIYEYAFTDKEQGEIVVTLKKPGDNKVVIMVTDNGSVTEKTPQTVKGKPNTRFILKSLVSKLNGETSYTHNPKIGSSCIISFPV